MAFQALFDFWFCVLTEGSGGQDPGKKGEATEDGRLQNWTTCSRVNISLIQID